MELLLDDINTGTHSKSHRTRNLGTVVNHVRKLYLPRGRFVSLHLVLLFKGSERQDAGGRVGV